jgi:sensor histidine kinase regulating citrate/malate metabolism
MNRENAIRCIQIGRYEEATNYITKMLMRDKIHTQRRRRNLTTELIARMLGRKYERIKGIDNGLTFQEKAEQALDETLMEQMPPEPSKGNLSDLLKDD